MMSFHLRQSHRSISASIRFVSSQAGARKQRTGTLKDDEQDKYSKYRIAIDNNNSDSLSFTSISKYFTSLRLKAVSALSSSLNTNERNELLKSLKAIDETTASETTRKSVGEAVAYAMKQEAEKNSKYLEEKQNEIYALAEQAALERVKSDLQMLQKTDVSQQKQQQQQHHPILGELVADLGYKRIHVTSAKRLSAIPVWEKQRIYRHDRAKAMASDKLKKKEIGLPGIISLHEHSSTGKLCILDGQHRVGMMTILSDKENVPFDLDRILIEVFSSEDENDVAKELFIEINKAEPVKLVDMPGVASSNSRKVINEVASTLSQRYPTMFSSSQRCRSPHVNIDNLRDVIFTSDIMNKYNLRTSQELLDWILKKNSEIGEGFLNSSDDSTELRSRVIQKAIKCEFFLGLDSSWLYK